MADYIKMYMPRMVPTLSAGCAKDDSIEIIRRLAIRRCARFFLSSTVQVYFRWDYLLNGTILCPLCYSLYFIYVKRETAVV